MYKIEQKTNQTSQKQENAIIFLKKFDQNWN